MCFSAQASFAGAVIAGSIGVANLTQIRSKSQILLALIPCFFGIQQMFEGILWLMMSSVAPDLSLEQLVIKAYLFFAIIFWPLWIPLSLFVMEKDLLRRKLLLLTVLGGVGLALVNIYYGFVQQIPIQIVGHSIQYLGNIPEEKLIYILLVVLPFFISSFKNMWHLGILIAVSAMFTYYFYTETFVSVWCFFGAIVSIYLFKIFWDNAKITRS